MSDHPSTYKAALSASDSIEWDDRAAVHMNEDGQGLLDGMKALRRGTLAEMVAYVSKLPESERSQYVIQKAGDHRLDISEIMALAAHPDFPG
ncbi:hypothetical protein [Altericroceibacterium endophyticum]|uniref:Uncharacterized protein n=1 Tax=Altericroceibacterium endophyticum TaxID=1808508 RepID=A0A6I4T763_9SPHN|nr:hypothetical protein [Altericroceibacterium endophyticum]MXO66052.1 hypothetical protein [Altericroceibacterium endophyticum]